MKPFAKPPLIRLEELTAQDGHSTGAAAGKESGPGRKGRPWTAEEHLAFLQGLRALGKGNWKGISRLFLFGARTPTQVWCSSLRRAVAAVLQTERCFSDQSTGKWVGAGADASRVPAKVASHAQKHELRQAGKSCSRRKSRFTALECQAAVSPLALAVRHCAVSGATELSRRLAAVC